MILDERVDGITPLDRERTDLYLTLPMLADAARRSMPLGAFAMPLELDADGEPRLERRSNVNASGWLARLARIVDPGDRGEETKERRSAKIHAAVYIVLDTFDDLLFARNEERCREILELTDVELFPIEVLLSLLGATLRARHALGEARAGLCRRIEEKLRRDTPERVELLLRGLR